MPAGLEFVDTNVLVYAYDLSSPEKRARAIPLLETLLLERRLALSLRVLQEFSTPLPTEGCG
ncbi:hypothetical protein [Thermus islandicus]|uniref:hypothetical protein n=1 Tax=Thermus islandicus TaxID=540988 RepID=UPI0004138FD4|nr:hypothetical protein [Thermus islandicus]